jgi:hypothetical protein
VLVWIVCEVPHYCPHCGQKIEWAEKMDRYMSEDFFNGASFICSGCFTAYQFVPKEDILAVAEDLAAYHGGA